MMLLDSLTIALLSAGILSSSIAQGRILRSPKFPPSESQYYPLLEGDTSPAVDYYIEILDPANYVNFSREQCEENGGPNAYDKLQANLQQFLLNVQILFEPLRRETKIALTYQRGKLPSLVKKYCRKIPTLQKYVNRVTRFIRACGTEAGVGHVMGDRYFVNELLDYMCQDEGSGLARFIADDGMECLASKKRGLLNCANENFGRYLPGGQFDGDVVSAVGGFEMLLTPNTKRCVDVRNFQSCITDVLNDCEKPTTGKALNDLIDFIIKVTSCVPTMVEISEVERHVSTIAQNVPSEDKDFLSFLVRKCEKNGDAALVSDFSGESLEKMVAQGFKILDLERVQHEIEYAAFESNSHLETALALHCRKVPIAIGIEKFITGTLKSCLDPDELAMDVFHNVTSSLLEAACYNEGNAIAAFVAGDGVQCMEYKREELKSCFREIFGGYFEAGGWRKRATPETPFVIDFKDCEDMERLRNCSVQALTECDDKTASYMLDSVFDIIHDRMSCEELREVELRREWSPAEYLADMFRGQLKDQCETHGGPPAYEAVKGVSEYVASGLALVTINIGQLHYDMEEALLDDQVDLFFKKYCRKIPALQKFIKHAVESVTPCFDKVDLYFQSGLAISLLDTICEDEGKRSTKLVASGGLDCIEAQQDSIHQCIPRRYSNEFRGLVKVREDLDAEECTAINQTQECLIDVLKKCEVPEVVQFVMDLNNSFFKDTACGPQDATTD